MGKTKPTYEELRQENDNLLKQLAQYKTIVDYTVDWEILMLPTGEFSFCSPSCLNISGYEAKEFIENHDLFLQIIHPLDREIVEKHFFKKKHDTETDADLEFRIITKDGKLKWIEHFCRKAYDNTGKFVGYRSSNRDITKRKEAEQKLIENETLYRSLTESSGDAIYLLIDRKFEFINPAFESLFGYSLKEINRPGVDFTLIVAPESRPLVDSGFEKIQKGKKVSTRYEFKALTKAGEIKDVETQISFIQVKGIKAKQGIIRDITERKKAEKVKEKQTRLLQLLLELSSNFINLPLEKTDNAINYALAKIGEFVGADRSYVFDYDFEKRVTNNAYEWCCEGIEPQIDNLQEVPLDGIPDWVNTHKKGEKMYIPDVLALPKGNLRDILEPQNIKSLITVPLIKNNECLGFAGFDSVRHHHSYTETEQQLLELFGVMLVNIKMRSENERDMHKSRKRLNDAERMARLSHWELNLQDNSLFWSEEVYRIFEIDPSRFKPSYELFLETIHPGDREMVDKAYKNSLKKRKPYKITHRLLFNDGRIKYVEEQCETHYDSEGKALYSLGTIQDITETKEKEHEILKFSGATQSSLTAIALANLEGNLIYVNPACEDLWGYKAEEMVGKPAISFWQNESQAQEVVDTINSGRTWRGEMIAERKDGEKIILEGSANVVIDNSGNPVSMQGSFMDVTERRQYEANLETALEKAKESDRLKSAFLANMSHEIRTPMNGILGFSELLKEPGLAGEQQQEYIRIIEKSGARMLNIINDIVDISKIEAGLMNVNIKETNINEKIEFIYIFFKPQVEEKGMQLLFKNTLPTKEAIIRTDNEKVYSILTNLVKNAIKYSKEGAIEFGYQKRGEFLEFYVKDTGIGIPKDRQSAIFERFIQADITDKMALQGAGLGLSISKAYVEMLGGKIWVESEEGIGSTFYFTLPYNSEPEEKKVVGKVVPAQDEKNQIKKLIILIAEDDETSEMLITIDVGKFSKEILKAKNGSEAVEVCRNNPDTDLILMDIQMPVMNGHEATRQIRQFNKNVVIIAQTAFGLSGDRVKAIEAGCNDYLSKPINKAELLSLIQKYFKK